MCIWFICFTIAIKGGFCEYGNEQSGYLNVRLLATQRLCFMKLVTDIKQKHGFLRVPFSVFKRRTHTNTIFPPEMISCSTAANVLAVIGGIMTSVLR